MRLALISLLMIPLTLGCGADKTDSVTEECFSNEDCPAGQICVIRHDHEGDDHDHGGACEEADVETDADDTGTPGPDYVHTFSVSADVPFEHTEAVVLRGEETWPICEDCPEGLTVNMTSDDADALLLYSGTLAAGTYAFSLRLKHVLDAPTEYSTIDATITAE